MTPRASRCLIVLLLLGACGEPERTPPSETETSVAEAFAGEPVVAEARVDASRVEIGDRVEFDVEVRVRRGYEVELPFLLESLRDLAVIDFEGWSAVEAPGGRTVHRTRLVLDAGIGPLLEIPALTIPWRREGEESFEELRTEAIVVEVALPEGEGEELREPLEGLELPPPPPQAGRDERALVFGILGGTAALLLGLWFLLFRRRRRRRIAVPRPDEVALAEIERLEGAGLLEDGRLQEFYYRLTAVLRRYVEDRFGIMAPERTTEEFLVEMRRDLAISDERKGALRAFLESADLVKYARATPPLEEARRAAGFAREFVGETRDPHAAERFVEEEADLAV